MRSTRNNSGVNMQKEKPFQTFLNNTSFDISLVILNQKIFLKNYMIPKLAKLHFHFIINSQVTIINRVVGDTKIM